MQKKLTPLSDLLHPNCCSYQTSTETGNLVFFGPNLPKKLIFNQKENMSIAIKFNNSLRIRFLFRQTTLNLWAKFAIKRYFQSKK